MTAETDIAALLRRIEVLEAEADIRRIQARYMFLCDTPNPEFGVADETAWRVGLSCGGKIAVYVERIV